MEISRTTTYQGIQPLHVYSTSIRSPGTVLSKKSELGRAMLCESNEDSGIRWCRMKYTNIRQMEKDCNELCAAGLVKADDDDGV